MDSTAEAALFGPRPRTLMPRTPPLLAVLLLAGCASTYEVDSATALSGKELADAIALYGPWEQRTTMEQRPAYVWRRRLVEGEASYYCELWVTMGFRETISSSSMQGFPRACQLFNIRYESKLK